MQLKDGGQEMARLIMGGEAEHNTHPPGVLGLGGVNPKSYIIITGGATFLSRVRLFAL